MNCAITSAMVIEFPPTLMLFIVEGTLLVRPLIIVCTSVWNFEGLLLVFVAMFVSPPFLPWIGSRPSIETEARRWNLVIPVSDTTRARGVVLHRSWVALIGPIDTHVEAMSTLDGRLRRLGARVRLADEARSLGAELVSLVCVGLELLGRGMRHEAWAVKLVYRLLGVSDERSTLAVSTMKLSRSLLSLAYTSLSLTDGPLGLVDPSVRLSTSAINDLVARRRARSCNPA